MYETGEEKETSDHLGMRCKTKRPFITLSRSPKSLGPQRSILLPCHTEQRLSDAAELKGILIKVFFSHFAS